MKDETLEFRRGYALGIASSIADYCYGKEKQDSQKFVDKLNSNPEATLDELGDTLRFWASEKISRALESRGYLGAAQSTMRSKRGFQETVADLFISLEQDSFTLDDLGFRRDELVEFAKDIVSSFAADKYPDSGIAEALEWAIGTLEQKPGAAPE